MGLDTLMQSFDDMNWTLSLSQEDIENGYWLYAAGCSCFNQVDSASDLKSRSELYEKSIAHFKEAWSKHQCILSFLMLISLALNDVHHKKKIGNSDISSLTIRSFIRNYVIADPETQLECDSNSHNLLGLFALLSVTPNALYAYPVHIPLICALTLSALASVIEDAPLKSTYRDYGRACTTLATLIYRKYKQSKTVLFGAEYFGLTMQREFREFSLDEIISTFSASNTRVGSCRDLFFSMTSPVIQQQIENTQKTIEEKLDAVDASFSEDHPLP